MTFGEETFASEDAKPTDLFAENLGDDMDKLREIWSKLDTMEKMAWETHNTT